MDEIWKTTKFGLINKIKSFKLSQMRIKKINILLLANFHNEEDKLLKLRNQIL